VHNARVCYFNNVWLMFLVFKKNFCFQITVNPHSIGPSHFSLRFFNPSIPPRLGPSHFSLRFFTPSTPPRPVLRISHSDSLTRRSRQIVVAVVDDTYYKITTTNYISKTSLYITLLGSFWGNLFSLFQPEIYFFYTF
jgi:hypothetical protein